MSNSRVVCHEKDIDLDFLGPTCSGLSNYWQVQWSTISKIQRTGIYMRPLFTLTPEGSAHFNCVLVVQGEIVLLDTWDSPEISRHTAISTAFHTVRDGFNETLQGIRVQLASQGKTNQCWSRLFIYMARLVRYLRVESTVEDVFDILADTQVIHKLSNVRYCKFNYW